MIDTHSHIYLEEYDADLPDVLRRAREAGVTEILCPAVSSASHERLLALCRKEPMCRPMMGMHPTEITAATWREEFSEVERYLASDSGASPNAGFCAVGEVGLDLHYGDEFLSQQIETFEAQIELALRYDLPLAVHSRDAWPETLAVLERYRDRGLRGVMHAFSGEFSVYERVRKLGDFVFGVGGPVTYKKNLWLDLLPRMALSDIVLETDAPWLAPVPMRGQRNEPAYLIYIRAAAAGLLGVPEARVDELTDANAKRIFGV